MQPKWGGCHGLVGEHAQLVASVGNAAILWRRLQRSVPRPALGAAAKIPPARPQRSIPPLKMPTARGWAPRQTPVEAPGLQVNALAPGLKHPSWIHVLPNGDVPVAGALFPPGPVKALFGHAMVSTMGSGGRLGQSEPHHLVA
jgi:glucose/arabinose dehydrogenase